MSPLRERMMRRPGRPGSGDATGLHPGGAPAGRALPALARSAQRSGGTRLPARVAPTGLGARNVQDQLVRPPLLLPAHTRPWLGSVPGKKGSSCLARSGCLMRCRMIRSVNCSATSATRSPGRASPPCMRAACASAKPPRWRSAPSTAPTRCCVSLGKATRSGWRCCLSRFSTSWAPCGGAIATRAGCSRTGAGMGRSTNACCRIPSPPRLTRRVFATG